MSIRTAGFDAAYSSLTIAGPGTELGEDTVAAGHYALVIDGDETAYLEGDPQTLDRKLRTALAALELLVQRAAQENAGEDPSLSNYARGVCDAWNANQRI